MISLSIASAVPETGRVYARGCAPSWNPLCGAYFPEVCAGCRLQAAGSPFPVLSGDPNCHDSPFDCPSVRVGTWLRSAGGGAGRKRRFCQLPPFVGLCPLGLTDALGGVARGESHASSR